MYFLRISPQASSADKLLDRFEVNTIRKSILHVLWRFAIEKKSWSTRHSLSDDSGSRDEDAAHLVASRFDNWSRTSHRSDQKINNNIHKLERHLEHSDYTLNLVV